MSQTGLLIYRRRELLGSGYGDTAIDARRRSREIESVVPGVYAPPEAWSELDPMERHRIRVLETAARMRTQRVFSHHAAAALHGIRILPAWPDRIDVTMERATGGRTGGLLRRHCTGLEDVETVELDGLVVTSPAQTVVDLARSSRFADGVAAMDSALHRRRKPAPLTTIEKIMERVAACHGRSGFGRALAAARFATPLSDSVEESHSRVQLHLLGFPAPVLQHHVRLPDGGDAYLDFYFPEHDHGGECDGKDKYTNPEFLRGRTPAEAVLDEKDRENQIRRVIGRLSRWEPRQLYPPTRLYDRLVRDGLPSSKPRPRPIR